jgi:Serine dehydratase beta chain
VKTSLFEIFKIGIAPSCSHAVVRMRAADDLTAELNRELSLESAKRIQAELYASVALTGKGARHRPRHPGWIIQRGSRQGCFESFATNADELVLSTLSHR